MSSSRHQRLDTYGPAPEPGPPPAYDFVKVFGNLAVTAGILSDGVGPVVDAAAGARFAEQAMATLLQRLRQQLASRGGIEAVQQIIRLEGYVFAGQDFFGHSLVLDGASRVLFRVFQDTPDKGRHTRVAVGSPSLPNGGAGRGRAVELSLWVELKPRAEGE